MEPLASPKITVGTHCLRLRTKTMYVPSMLDASENAYDPYDSSAYWCLDTQTAFGPDGQPVRADVCQGGRGCCKF